jgi:hypothetical protein
MGWFDDIKNFAGSLYNTGSEAISKVGNVINAIGATANKWLEGEFHAPDFVGGGSYSYCGPGTKLGGQAPINKVDEHCKTHDYEYDAFERNKNKIPASDLKRMVRESDNKLVSNIERSGQNDFGSMLSKWGIKGKIALEDLGLLNPLKFIGN